MSEFVGAAKVQLRSGVEVAGQSELHPDRVELLDSGWVVLEWDDEEIEPKFLPQPVVRAIHMGDYDPQDDGGSGFGGGW